MHILAINPGATSTKVAVYDDHTELFREEIVYDPERFSGMGEVVEQLDIRAADIEQLLTDRGEGGFDAVVGRGGLIGPVRPGAYVVDDAFEDVVRHRPTLQHASNLGGLLAEVVQAGVAEPAVLAEAVDYQREAYQLTPEDHPHRARRASNLGGLLAEAVRAGLLQPAVLVEAVRSPREAYQLTPEDHPHRAGYATNLGRLLADAGQAGLLQPAVLVEAGGYPGGESTRLESTPLERIRIPPSACKKKR